MSDQLQYHHETHQFSKHGIMGAVPDTSTASEVPHTAFE